MTGLRSRHAMLVRSINKGCEQRMRRQRLRLEFRMELAAEEPRMIRQLNDFHEILVGRDARNDQTVFSQHLLELPIEFVSMTMPLGNDIRLVNSIGQRAGLQIRRIRSQPHCPTDRVDTEQIAQFINDGVWRVRIELGAVGVFQSANILRVLDDSALHPETNAEIRNLLFARELDRANHSGNAALAETAGHENSIELTQEL